MKYKYPLSNTSWKENEISALRKVISSNKFTMGKKFRDLKKYLQNI